MKGDGTNQCGEVDKRYPNQDDHRIPGQKSRVPASKKQTNVTTNVCNVQKRRILPKGISRLFFALFPSTQGKRVFEKLSFSV